METAAIIIISGLPGKTGSDGTFKCGLQTADHSGVVANTRMQSLGSVRCWPILTYLMTHLDMLYNCTYIVAHDLCFQHLGMMVSPLLSRIDRYASIWSRYYMLPPQKDRKSLWSLITEPLPAISCQCAHGCRSIESKELGNCLCQGKRFMLSERITINHVRRNEQLVPR